MFLKSRISCQRLPVLRDLYPETNLSRPWPKRRTIICILECGFDLEDIFKSKGFFRSASAVSLTCPFNSESLYNGSKFGTIFDSVYPPPPPVVKRQDVKMKKFLHLNKPHSPA